MGIVQHPVKVALEWPIWLGLAMSEVLAYVVLII